MLARRTRRRCEERRIRADRRCSPPRSDKPFKLGDLVEPFDPPPLAELDKTAEWVDQPRASTAWTCCAKQRPNEPPPVTVDEALALRNDSPRSEREDSQRARPRARAADGTRRRLRRDLGSRT